MWIGAHKLDLFVFSFTECCNNISWQNTLENRSNALDQLEYAHALKYGIKKNYIPFLIIGENLSKMKNYLVFWMRIYNMLF